MNNKHSLIYCDKIICCLKSYKNRLKLIKGYQPPSAPGVYVIFDNNKLIYAGETANLSARYKDLWRTYNHTFRRKYAVDIFNRFKIRIPNIDPTRKKYPPKYENLIDDKMGRLYFKYCEIYLGRKEVEERLLLENDLPFNKRPGRARENAEMRSMAKN